MRRFPKRCLRLVAYALAALLLAVAGLGLAWWTTLYRPSPPQRGHLALAGATVLVGPELRPLPDATVLVRDGEIVAVGRDGEVEVPADAQVHRLPGHTVLPGLIDMHVHLGSPEREAGEGIGLLDWPGLIADALRYVPGNRHALLAHGVTGVRSLGDEHAWILEMRRMLAAGELEGPRVFAAGSIFTTRGGHPVATFGIDPGSDLVRLPRSPAQARAMRARWQRARRRWTWSRWCVRG